LPCHYCTENNTTINLSSLDCTFYFGTINQVGYRITKKENPGRLFQQAPGREQNSGLFGPNSVLANEFYAEPAANQKAGSP